MSTELKKFTEAYATMTVALYEPLFVKWISGWTIYLAANTMAWRLQKAKYLKIDEALATAQALNVGKIRTRRVQDVDLGDVDIQTRPRKVTAVDHAGNPISEADIQRIKLEGFPNAVVVGDTIYPYGVLNVQPKQEAPQQGFFARMFGRTATRAAGAPGNPGLGARMLPKFTSGGVGRVDLDFDFTKARKSLFGKLSDAVQASIQEEAKPLVDHLNDALSDVGGLQVFDFLPAVNVEEALSPIGIAHFYRQFYFNAEEGFGPIEQAFTVAPLETLEVVYETTRRQIHEELVEIGSETVSEIAQEEKNLDEISDKVSSMIQRDNSAAMSVSGSGGVAGVWQASGSASAEISTSTQRSREETSRRLKEVTKRGSERVTKSFSIKTRDLEELTTTNVTRRIIRNELANPVSFGLRRVLRRVLVKVQDLGPRLVWQLYVRNPGIGLAQSNFVHFRKGEPIAPPDLPPGLRPRPKGGTDTGSTTSPLLPAKHPEIVPPPPPPPFPATDKFLTVEIVIHAGADRIVTGVSIDSITDLEGGGKDDDAPAPINDVQWEVNADEDTGTYTYKIAIHPGDSDTVSLTYTYTWEPAPHILKEWETERAQRVKELKEELLNEQFEREKTLITERSKIRTRPSNELRHEERYEVINRMVSQLFARGDDPSDPMPVEIECFHRYFKIESMFFYLHPSWWKPRYTPVGTGLGRPAYEITAESEPAPLGSSLGWVLQDDGDNRRNEFLNSSWARVCLPIHPKREREAIEWLAKHVEGHVKAKFGYDPDKSPLKDILEDIEEIRSNEDTLGPNGPDYVTIDSSVGAPEGPLKPENVYPVVDEFEVTVPTDGFVFDELQLS